MSLYAPSKKWNTVYTKKRHYLFTICLRSFLFSLEWGQHVACIIFICKSFLFRTRCWRKKKKEYANAFGTICPFSYAKETDILLYTSCTINSNSLRRRRLFFSRSLFLWVFLLVVGRRWFVSETKNYSDCVLCWILFIIVVHTILICNQTFLPKQEPK